MSRAESDRRLVYVRAADLDRWSCRPLVTVDVLDLKDRPMGRLDGVLIEREANRPVYIAVRRVTDEERTNAFLVPVGEAWFDETARGHSDGRYRGEHLAYGEMEYRGTLTSNGLLGVVAFLNTTTVQQSRCEGEAVRRRRACCRMQ